MRIARLPTDESKRFFKDEADRLKHIRGAQKDFGALVQQLQPLVVQVKAEFPAKDATSIQRRGRAITKLLKEDSRVTAYLDKWVGKEADHEQAYSWRGGLIYQFRDVLVLGKTLKDAFVEIEKQAFKGFEAILMTQVQAPLRQALPVDLLQFLPKNIVVEVDKAGNIAAISDRFENEHFTLGKKVERMRALVQQYNAIVKRVRKDLKSSDELVKLSALVTAIIMETGIRPGKEGNGVAKTVDGESIHIETFGAITLGPAHVRFIRSNFTELEFLGKKGGVNTATLSDESIIKVLNDYVARALSTGSKYIFVTAAGVAFSYTDLQRYFTKNFDGFAPTDFRKLKATETLMGALREAQGDLYARIRAFTQTAVGDLKERVTAEVVTTFNAAVEKAQGALSHDNADTTVRSYINPEIVLRFLSTGRVDDNLETAILSGKTRLQFDPQVFLQAAGVKLGSSGRGASSLGELLVTLREEMAQPL